MKHAQLLLLLMVMVLGASARAAAPLPLEAAGRLARQQANRLKDSGLPASVRGYPLALQKQTRSSLRALGNGARSYGSVDGPANRAGVSLETYSDRGSLSYRVTSPPLGPDFRIDLKRGAPNGRAELRTFGTLSTTGAVRAMQRRRALDDRGRPLFTSQRLTFVLPRAVRRANGEVLPRGTVIVQKRIWAGDEARGPLPISRLDYALLPGQVGKAAVVRLDGPGLAFRAEGEWVENVARGASLPRKRPHQPQRWLLD